MKDYKHYKTRVNLQITLVDLFLNSHLYILKKISIFNKIDLEDVFMQKMEID